jgi:hypothetical protein
MSLPTTSISDFRVHIAISQVNNEILISPMTKSSLTPYPDIDPGYVWEDFEPVTTITFTSTPELLGKTIKSTIQLSLFHYEAPETKTLLANRDVRREYLIKKFGKNNPRFIHPPSFLFIASTASDYSNFCEKYNHLFIENDRNINIRIVPGSTASTSGIQIPILAQIPFDCPNDILGQKILDINNSKIFNQS